MKKILIIVCLFIQIVSQLKADVTISASRSFNLAGSFLPDDLKQTAEAAYCAALKGNINILRSKVSSLGDIQFQANKIKVFCAALHDPRFCSLLSGSQGIISGEHGERGYILILTVVGGEPGSSYSLSNFIHIWYLDGQEWKLLVPNYKLFAPLLRQDSQKPSVITSPQA